MSGKEAGVDSEIPKGDSTSKNMMISLGGKLPVSSTTLVIV